MNGILGRAVHRPADDYPARRARARVDAQHVRGDEHEPRVHQIGCGGDRDAARVWREHRGCGEETRGVRRHAAVERVHSGGGIATSRRLEHLKIRLCSLLLSSPRTVSHSRLPSRSFVAFDALHAFARIRCTKVKLGRLYTIAYPDHLVYCRDIESLHSQDKPVAHVPTRRHTASTRQPT